MEKDDIYKIVNQLIENIEKVIAGKKEVIEMVLIGLFSNGHILIQDVPGVGKTMLARALAKSINAKFRRIQFTPDLLPTDITGTSIYNRKTQEFEFKPGPIFSNIILADEINRTTPRTQSGLLECMQEYKVTIDGIGYELEKPFFVIATQNPIEFHGTYPLPESQLDRFLLQLEVGYPEESMECIILNKHMKEKHPIELLTPIIELSQIVELQKQVSSVYVSPEIVRYIVKIVNMTRSHPEVKLGISPRGCIAIMQASRARALLLGRDYVTPNDVKSLVYPVFSHRITLQPHALVKELDVKSIINQILESVSVPL